MNFLREKLEKKFEPKNIICKDCRRSIAIADWKGRLDGTEEIINNMYCLKCAKKHY